MSSDVNTVFWFCYDNALIILILPNLTHVSVSSYMSMALTITMVMATLQFLESLWNIHKSFWTYIFHTLELFSKKWTMYNMKIRWGSLQVKDYSFCAEVTQEWHNYEIFHDNHDNRFSSKEDLNCKLWPECYFKLLC